MNYNWRDEIFRCFHLPAEHLNISESSSLTAAREARYAFQSTIDRERNVQLARLEQRTAWVSAIREKRPKHPTKHVLFRMERRKARRFAKAYRIMKEEILPVIQKILADYMIDGERYKWDGDDATTSNSVG